MTGPSLSAHDRNEMIRAFNGLLTAKVANDPVAVTSQLETIAREQVEASRGDIGVFAARMTKQVEAGAVVAHSLLKSLAPRLGLTEAEVQQIYSETATFNDLVEE